MKKPVPYDEEELEALQAWEAGALKPFKNAAAQAKAHRAAADATFKKDQCLNIRISSRDLNNLQARALEEGVPYQTFTDPSRAGLPRAGLSPTHGPCSTWPSRQAAAMPGTYRCA